MMKRRDFLRSMAGTLPALATLRGSGVAGHGPAPFEGWTWVHGGGERTAGEWRAEFARLYAAGIRGVLVGGGETGMLADAAHGAGLRFHRWVWMLNRSGDPWVQQHHPEWFDVSRNGDSSLVKPPYVSYYKWLCPTRPAVREYLRGIVAQIAADPRVDGVHLDYIRHPDVILPRGLWAKYGLVQDHEMPQFDFCYCDVCRATFKAQSGYDPLHLEDPTSDVPWRKFRWDSVTGVVKVVATAVHGAEKRLTAAVFPTPAIARTLVRQAWDEWPLDAAFPMIYHNFYEKPVAWIGPATREGVTALRGRAALYSGLYLPSLTPDELTQAVALARANGANGVSLFESGGITEAHAAALKEVLAGA
ncbi:MAG TPA: hypothetical protein VJ992_12925 [Gemmatimonadales bacterium]|nr:hypothetical protein [Gemmatimonadales bacterium]